MAIRIFKLREIRNKILSDIEAFKNVAFQYDSWTALGKHYGMPVNGSTNKWLQGVSKTCGLGEDFYDHTAHAQVRKYEDVVRKCKFCNTSFQTQAGGKRSKYYCGQSCANKDRKYSETAANKRRETNKKKGRIPKICHSACGCCNKPIASLYVPRMFCSKTCSNKVTNNRPDVKEKRRQIQLKRFAEGRHKGWVSRAKVNISYPERFFIKVLTNNKISFERELPQGGRFIDFAIVTTSGTKIALEIDGGQHRSEDRQRSDRIKDIMLESMGWNVYRIPWKSINTKPGKEYIRDEISKFINYYIAFSQ